MLPTPPYEMNAVHMPENLKRFVEEFNETNDDKNSLLTLEGAKKNCSRIKNHDEINHVEILHTESEIRKSFWRWKVELKPVA